MKEKEFIIEEVKENFNIQLIFCESKIDLLINNDYESFLNQISKILKILNEDIKSVTLRYIDDDKDTIIISNSGDYEIFFSQVKDNLVNKLEIKIKEKSGLDGDKCLANFLNYAEQKNNNINQNNNKFNNENKINYIKEFEINQKDNLSDKNEDNMSDDEIILENNNNIIQLKQDDDNNNEVNLIDNYFNNNDNKTIFDCECSSCNKFPIKGVMYLCPECDINLCPECKENIPKHMHELTKIETEEQLIENLEKAFELIEKQEKEEIQEIRLIEENNEIEEIQENTNDKKKSFFHLPKWIKKYWNKKKN